VKFRIFLAAVLSVISWYAAFSWSDTGKTGRVKGIEPGLGANDLGNLAWDGSSLWVSGSGTLNNLVGEGYLVTDWMSYRGMEGFGQGANSALLASGDTLITAWSYTDDAGYSVGDGLSISVDRGRTWRRVTITDLFPERSDWRYPGRYTMIYDLRYSGKTLWCSATSGFLLRTDDLGYTWTQILPDSNGFDFGNLNHHGYCVDVYGDTLWVGTFRGINSSFDGGNTWTNYSWPPGSSGDTGNRWPGNWVYSVEHKVVRGKTHVWVGSGKEIANTGLGMDGICHTDDNGATWEYMTTDYNAWNFAFGRDGAGDPAVSDETVFAASDSGLAVSYDLGETWEVLDIVESDHKAWPHGTMIYDVMAVDDTLWVTSSDGIARSNDWGKTWAIFQGVTRVRTIDTGQSTIGASSWLDNQETYAFPNPFSPKRPDQDYSRTRIQYALGNDARVTIRIYDYTGRLVRELITDEYRSGGRDYQEPWNGADSDNTVVPNGVYFYVITTDTGHSARGKIMVLD